MISKIETVNVVELLYDKPWTEIQDTTSEFTNSQSNTR